MNRKLIAGELLFAALLLGCSSDPKLTLPSGQWVEINQPKVAPPMQLTTAAPSMYYPGPPTAPAMQPGPISPRSATPAPASAPMANVGPSGPSPAPVTQTQGATPAIEMKTPPAPSPVPPVPQAPKAPVTQLKPVPKPPDVPTLAPPKVFQSTPPAVTVVAPSTKPLKPMPVPKPVWEAPVGDSLRQVISNWSKRANYTLDWRAEDLDYPIDAPLRFQGSYEEAVAEIFQLYENADRSFKVDGRRKQSRLIVLEDRDKTKRTKK